VSPVDIIHDVEKGVAALIDSTTGRALGPTAYGESAVSILEHGLATLDQDPATMNTADLAHAFGRVEGALAMAEPPAAGEPPASTPTEAVTAPGPPSAPTEGQTPTEAPAGPEAPAQPVSAPSTPPAGPTVPPSSGEVAPPSEGQQSTPSAGQKLCPECDGFRTVVVEGQTQPCPACGATGVVPA
jgi:hypothetical protein